jgi:hypothetical protein
MALISEWMEQCGKKVIDDAGIVRDAIFQQLWQYLRGAAKLLSSRLLSRVWHCNQHARH